MKRAFVNIKKGTRPTFQWRGLMYRAEYQRRFFNKEIGEWMYYFRMGARDGNLPLPASEVQFIFFTAGGQK